MRIGIIGAENSHTAAIAKTLNIEKKVRGFSVDYVWGEADAFAQAAAKAGQIPNIVKTPRDMLGKIDALIVDHRHPKYHLKPALPFVKAGIPSFIDKPLCYRSDEGKAFLKTARQYKTPVTSFSVIPRQKSFAQFMKKMAGLGDIVAGATYGPCDLRSKYGGVFFYGIHQVDAALVAFGYDVSAALVSRNGNGATGQLFYRSGRIVTMNLVKEGCPGFAMTAVGTEGTCHQRIVFDGNTYLSGIRTFTSMFRTGEEPLTRDQMIKPVLVLEALDRSLRTGKKERVGR